MRVSNFQPPTISSDDTQSSSKTQVKPTTPAVTVRSPHKLYIIILRCSVLACIFTVAAVIGYFAYAILVEAEDSQFENTYDDLIKQLLPATNIGLMKTAAAVMNGAIVVGDVFSNSTHWPNVAYRHFPNIAILTSRLSSAVGIGFTPIVYPEQVQAFEDFAYHHYSQDKDRYPNGTAEAFFGRGIYNYDFTLTGVPDFKYHDTTGDLPWSSPHRFLTPYMQISGPGFSLQQQNFFLMLNLRAFEEAVMDLEDAILDCVANRVSLDTTCAMISGMKPYNILFRNNPHLFVMQPIIAQDDPHRVLGFISGTIFFSEIVKERVPVGTSGIDFVVRMDGQQHSYQIVDGIPVYVGAGDFHDTNYDDYGHSTTLMEGLIDPVGGMFTSTPESENTITFYPTNDYVSSFRTDLRWIICFGAVGLITFVTIVFILYDYFMVRENTEQQAVLETKRQFVRFISHEVRTPLNAVAMAGDLMREQLIESINKLRTAEDGQSPQRRSGASRGAVDDTLGEALELCEEILGNTKNAVEVLDDLLNYDKIEVGGLTLTLTFVAMENLLENVLKPFRGPAKLKNVTIDVQVDNFLRHSIFQNVRLFRGKFAALRILGDKIRLEQVIRNLVSNALKFTSPRGTIVVTLEWIESGKTSLDVGTTMTKAAAAILKPSQSPSPFSSLRRVPDSSVRSRQSSDPESSVSFAKQSNEHSFIFHSPREGIDISNISDHSKVDELSRDVIIKSSYARAPEDPATSVQWGALRLSVKDDGAGMSPEQLRSVCSEGVQFNANELQAGQGSGLGLFIAKGIVKQHGGTLTVSSAGLLKGSTFVVELPAYACDVFTPGENRLLSQTMTAVDSLPRALSFVAHTTPKHAPPSSSSGLRRSLESSTSTLSSVKEAVPTILSDKQKPVKKRRVLVVDDVSSNRKLVIRLLQRSGVDECEQAGDGQEAVNIYLAARQRLTLQTTSFDADDHVDSVSPFSSEPFDAILMDCEMPVMNGPTATKKLRELGCTVPIIGISGNVLPADVQLFIMHGANAVLPKPLDFNELEKVWKLTTSD